MRQAFDHLGDGPLAAFFLMLAVDARDTRLNIVSVPEFAAVYGFPVRQVRKYLATLDSLGWIDWQKSPNQHADSMVTIVRSLEAPRLRRAAAPDAAHNTASNESGMPTRGNAPHTEHRTRNTEHDPFHAQPAVEQRLLMTSEIIQHQCPDMPRKEAVGLGRNVDNQSGGDAVTAQQFVAEIAQRYHVGGDPMDVFDGSFVAWDTAYDDSTPALHWRREAGS